MNIKIRFILCLFFLLTGTFLFTGCSSTRETEGTATEKVGQEEPVEGIEQEREAIAEEKETKQSIEDKPQESSNGSGFEHNVEMDIEGTVEKDQDEGWWELD